MVLDFRYATQLDKVRWSLSLVVYPIKKIVDYPFNKVYQLGDYFSTQQRLFKENQAYKEEILLLQGRLQKLAALETENEHLKQLLSSGSEVTNDLYVANIINVDPDPFVQQIVIDKGQRDGVYVGQTIIDSDGIMGTVVKVDEQESQAILITDSSHAVPVEDVRNGLRAIAVGSGSGVLELRHVPNNTDIVEGDIMITSGLGGKFPVGFPVGKVVSVKRESNKAFAKIILQPSAKLDRGRHILLVRNPKGNFKDKIK